MIFEKWNAALIIKLLMMWNFHTNRLLRINYHQFKSMELLLNLLLRTDCKCLLKFKLAIVMEEILITVVY
jgi:hypothetical protein